jgi:hypothetical protein
MMAEVFGWLGLAAGLGIITFITYDFFYNDTWKK